LRWLRTICIKSRNVFDGNRIESSVVGYDIKKIHGNGKELLEVYGIVIIFNLNSLMI